MFLPMLATLSRLELVDLFAKFFLLASSRDVPGLDPNANSSLPWWDAFGLLERGLDGFLSIKVY